MAPKDFSKNFSMRISEDERQAWDEGADLLAEQSGTEANVSALVRVAVREKIARLKEERAKKKGGK